MTLASGTRVGNFEIAAPLGAGGMGEVYRARDMRLDRAVAIKSLPANFARDPERLARFEREAKLLASVNHPNIASIYGIEDAPDGSYLVLELVEGESLAQRLGRGPLSVREALKIGHEIAGALEAAHARGIVHRDLKPGNVMITAAGVAKVLDFGLAKGDADASPSSLDLSVTPTVALAATGAGIILGTAPYMSPEQARGKAVDRRSDVWSLGCVLYECLTGRQAFEGETTSDVIARILEREPDWSALPAVVPERLRDVLRRCLTRDAEDRPRDVGDIGRELASIASESAAGRSSSSMSAPSHAVPPSLAVLYFEDLSSDKQGEYFCAGITEDILTDLSKVRGMRVASRNAVARYRGKSADPAEVARDLGVTAVLEGSVRRAGERVRINAQLVSGADGFHLWAERYDRTLDDVFAVQEEIASAIAAALKVAMTPSEIRELGQDRPKDVKAYDLYLKGVERYGHYTKDSLQEALALFREATTVDPTYARAFAGIADCHGQFIQWGYAENIPETARLGLEAAHHAIALDPKRPEAYKAESLVLRGMGDAEGSVAAIRKAIDVDPRYVPALINLAVHEFSFANVAAAERLIRRALRIDPVEPFGTTWLAWIVHVTDRFDETLEQSARVRRLSDDRFYVTHSYTLRAMSELRRNDHQAAEQTVNAAIADGADRAILRSIDALIAARTGRTEEAKRMLMAEIEPAAQLSAGALIMAASAALRAGDPDLARRFMGRPLIGDLAAILVRLEPELHALLDRPPFAPRRSTHALVWPLEAPMMRAAVHAVFEQVRIESGLPEPESPSRS